MLRSSQDNDVESTITGYNERHTVMFDFDNPPDGTFVVVKCANVVMEYFSMWGWLILLSSKNHYHLIFDRPVGHEEQLRLIAWIAIVGLECGRKGQDKKYDKSKVEASTWVLMQVIKKGCTLRISSKGEKPPPVPIVAYGTQDHMIARYLETRKLFSNAND